MNVTTNDPIRTPRTSGPDPDAPIPLVPSKPGAEPIRKQGGALPTVATVPCACGDDAPAATSVAYLHRDAARTADATLTMLGDLRGLLINSVHGQVRLMDEEYHRAIKRDPDGKDVEYLRHALFASQGVLDALGVVSEIESEVYDLHTRLEREAREMAAKVAT